MAALACIEFFPTFKLPPRLRSSYQFVNVAADGRCLFSCLYLALKATKEEVFGWYHRPRSKTSGIPISSEDFVNEKKVVVDWGSQLPGIPDDTQSRLIRSYCAEDPDIEAHI